MSSLSFFQFCQHECSRPTTEIEDIAEYLVRQQKHDCRQGFQFSTLVLMFMIALPRPKLQLSFPVLQNLMRASISQICFLRNVFPVRTQILIDLHMHLYYHLLCCYVRSETLTDILAGVWFVVFVCIAFLTTCISSVHVIFRRPDNNRAIFSETSRSDWYFGSKKFFFLGCFVIHFWRKEEY